MARLTEQCQLGALKLFDERLARGAEAKVTLGPGMHCIRAVAVSEVESAPISLELSDASGRTVQDGLSSSMVVTPPRGPLCVSGPTTVRLRLRSDAPALVRVRGLPQPTTAQ